MANLTFEKAMKKLEQIVRELESGDQPLEKAIKKFEEGVQLSKFCSEKLDETEQRVTLLLKDQTGNVFEKPFISEIEPEDE
ncbi:MAG: exodeoxyribonuclease VII small subunit [Deltaproteobacteria bacterium]|jgi:exodeoxyribonuclease VII small subunit|nr:exodeoxyribonuclease VII small subunit [Deltaproteobacteria bacterium]MDX2497861.1 exodeoxyribonuclease VII small subunit [Desulfobacterales bacterium]MBW1747439.1 exodeoxyribonuclease VII small subunit [Deltaproteobacteria bacterium]MBW1827318.1 exodeoxyribonuclease VII small subunit [Deltaproteobacteria bacterium]MBW1969193.1 exodeoxyribonuclease VII small subunit [Deltaproteobacteria bacterium]